MVIAASLPHHKPTEARLLDILAFCSCPKRRRFSDYPRNKTTPEEAY